MLGLQDTEKNLIFLMKEDVWRASPASHGADRVKQNFWNISHLIYFVALIRGLQYNSDCIPDSFFSWYYCNNIIFQNIYCDMEKIHEL